MLQLAEQIERLSADEIRAIMNDHQLLVDMTNRLRESIKVHPTQSHFRVTAIMIFTHSNGILSMIAGSNAEEGYIGGAICAERACLTRLRLYEDPVILKVVVVTDSEDPISPGALCREYLMSAAAPTTTIVVGNCTGKHVAHCALAELWYSPYLYRYCVRANLVPYAQELHQRVSIVPASHFSPKQAKYIQKVITAAQSVTSRDHSISLHPIQMSAAVIFDDESTYCTWQLKGLEYGCTIDPVAQLIHIIEKQRYDNTNALTTISSGMLEEESTVVGDGLRGNVSNDDLSKLVAQHPLEQHVKIPVMIAMIDQYNVLHAPFAAARAQLLELGYTQLEVLVHNEEGGMEITTVGKLMPTPLHVCKFLTHDNFIV